MILAIDSSGASTQIALKGPDQVVRQAPVSCKSSQHEDLARAVKDLLTQAKASVSGIRLVLLSSGPGSFTGLRIGYSFVQGLIYNSKSQVLEVGSFESIAWNFRRETKLIAAIRDARRDEIFVQFFKASENEIVKLNEPEIILASALSARTNGIEAGDWIVVCASGEELAPELQATGYPLQASGQIATAMIEMYESGQGQAYSRSSAQTGASPLELSALSPKYLRAVSARKISERQLTK